MVISCEVTIFPLKGQNESTKAISESTELGEGYKVK
jgi:hypothetical protein